MAGLALVGMSGPVAAAGTWSASGSLNLGRTAFAAATLSDGSVLVAGGSPGSIVGRTAERYDAGADAWTRTGGLATGRSSHTVTALAEGTALAVGGNSPAGLLRTAEVYDAISGAWSATGSLATARANHTATRLADGRVLVAGGVAGNGGATNEVEVYDPATGSWSRAASLRNARYNHTATLLIDGRVLVAGGFTPGAFHTPSRKAEVFDPATNRWDVVGTMDVPRAVHAAVRLGDGRVLVAGGVTSPVNDITVTPSAEVFDPATGRWARLGDLRVGRRAIDAHRLPDGGVLVTGGFDAWNALTASSEVFDPSTGTWTVDAFLRSARAPVTAQLADGRILAIASVGRVTVTDVDVYDP